MENAHLEKLLVHAGDGDERDLLVAATRLAAELLGERASCVLLADGGARVVFSTHVSSVRAEPIELRDFPEFTIALDLREVVFIEDVRTDARLEAVHQRLPPELRSIGVVPLLGRAGPLGLLVAQSMSPWPVRAEALADADLLGRLTSRLLEGIRLQAPAPGPGSQPAAGAPGEEPGRAAPAPAGGPEAGRQGARLLVVDDDPDQVQTLAWILEQEGYRVEVATDGAESVRRAVASLPDLVLLDGHMPVLDGFAAARLLYADLRTRNIPILFVSGAIDLVSRVRGLGKGDVDFIAKPFSAEALLARIDRLLSQVDAAERLRRSALIDELTGLGNLRALNERLTLEQSRFGRYGTAMAMVVVDVDKLKEFNDRYGHIAGSQALAAVGQALRDTVRGSDLAVRYGGDEFVVLLPQCTAENGFAFAERLLARLHQLMPRERSITASVGVAAMEGRSARLIEELIPQADAAAYRAKRLGGDRACAYDPVADSTEPRIR